VWQVLALFFHYKQAASTACNEKNSGTVFFSLLAAWYHSIDDSCPTSHTSVSFLVTDLTTACPGFVLAIPCLLFNYAQI